jgi:hypothetical protein
VAFALAAAAAVVNPVVAFVQPAEVNRSKEHVPRPAGEGLAPDGQGRQDVGDVDPALLPPNAPVGRHAPDLEVLRVADRLEAWYVQSIGRGVEPRGPPLVERLMGAHLIEGTAEAIEATLIPALAMGGKTIRSPDPTARCGGVNQSAVCHEASKLISACLPRAGGLPRECAYPWFLAASRPKVR